jgi:hypothetical protein
MKYFKKIIDSFLILMVLFEKSKSKSIGNENEVEKLNKSDKIVDIFMFDDYFQQVLINFLFLNKTSTVDNLSDACNANLKTLIFSIIADKEWALRGNHIYIRFVQN